MFATSPNRSRRFRMRGQTPARPLRRYKACRGAGRLGRRSGHFGYRTPPWSPRRWCWACASPRRPPRTCWRRTRGCPCHPRHRADQRPDHRHTQRHRHRAPTRAKGTAAPGPACDSHHRLQTARARGGATPGARSSAHRLCGVGGLSVPTRVPATVGGGRCGGVPAARGGGLLSAGIGRPWRRGALPQRWTAWATAASATAGATASSQSPLPNPSARRCKRLLAFRRKRGKPCFGKPATRCGVIPWRPNGRGSTPCWRTSTTSGETWGAEVLGRCRNRWVASAAGTRPSTMWLRQHALSECALLPLHLLGGPIVGSSLTCFGISFLD